MDEARGARLVVSLLPGGLGAGPDPEALRVGLHAQPRAARRAQRDRQRRQAQRAPGVPRAPLPLANVCQESSMLESKEGLGRTAARGLRRVASARCA